MRAKLTVLFVFCCVSNVSFLYGDTHELDGTWRLVKRLVRGEEREVEFRHFRIAGEKMWVSNGVEEIPGWVDVDGSSIRMVHGADIFWRDSIYSNGIENGYFRVQGRTSLEIVSVLPYDKVDQFDDQAIAEAREVLFLEKLSETELSKFSRNLRSPESQEVLETLSSYGARFETNDYGQVIAIDLLHAVPVPLAQLVELTHLERILVPEFANTEGVDPFIEIEKERANQDLVLRYQSRKGIEFFKGRKIRAALEPLFEGNLIEREFPVFRTSSNNDDRGVPASLITLQGRLLAIHSRLPEPEAMATQLSHPDLKHSVGLGRVVMDRLGFQMRQINGDPPADWVFAPIPQEANALFRAIGVLVCTPEGSVPGFLDVSKVKTTDEIAPQSPSDWNYLTVSLAIDPNRSLADFAGCPVVDQRTGHLLGYTSSGKKEGGIMFRMETVHDFTRGTADPGEYDGLDFFGVKGGSGNGDASKMAGIIAPHVLRLRLGETKYGTVMMEWDGVIHANNEVPLGREYLLSQLYFGGDNLGKIRLVGRNIRLDDERIRRMTNWIFGEFGEPGKVYRRGEIPESSSLGFLWRNDVWSIYYKLEYSGFLNTLLVEIELRKPPERNSPDVFLAEVPNPEFPKMMVHQFLDAIEELPQEPLPWGTTRELMDSAIQEWLQRPVR